MADGLSVEERLDKARLLVRTSSQLLVTLKSIDQLLRGSKNVADAARNVQELARQHAPAIIALRWVPILVDIVDSDSLDAKLAACGALAAVSVSQEGRDAIRASGGLRPLVLLLSEGSRSLAAAAAALTLMNCSACDRCKEVIADCRGVPQLVGLISGAIERCAPPPTESGQLGTGPGAGAGQGAGAGGAGTGGGRSADPRATAAALASGELLRSPGDCRAAVYAAGALMNMGAMASVQGKMVEAGAVSVFHAAARAAQPGDMVATRGAFVLTWLAAAGGALLDGEGEGAEGPEGDSRRPSTLGGSRPGTAASGAAEGKAASGAAEGKAAVPAVALPHFPGASAASTPRVTGTGLAASPAPSSPATPSAAAAHRAKQPPHAPAPAALSHHASPPSPAAHDAAPRASPLGTPSGSPAGAAHSSKAGAHAVAGGAVGAPPPPQAHAPAPPDAPPPPSRAAGTPSQAGRPGTRQSVPAFGAAVSRLTTPASKPGTAATGAKG